MIDIMFIGQNVGISGCKSEEKHQYQHFLDSRRCWSPKQRVLNERSFTNGWLKHWAIAFLPDFRWILWLKMDRFIILGPLTFSHSELETSSLTLSLFYLISVLFFESRFARISLLEQNFNIRTGKIYLRDGLNFTTENIRPVFATS